MAIDETLLESAADGGGFSLRFYRWLEPTLSLGYFQQYDDRWQHAASRNCPAVRRATGGGAILHDREITYSFTVPPGHSLALKHLTLYESVHAALIEALAGYGINTSLCRGEGRQPDRKEPFLCFQRRSPGDVLLGAVKIAGSASVAAAARSYSMAACFWPVLPPPPELSGLAEEAAIALSFDQLVQTWLSKLAETLSMQLQPGILSGSEQRRAEDLVREKYDSTDWTRSRGGKMHAEKSGHISTHPPL